MPRYVLQNSLEMGIFLTLGDCPIMGNYNYGYQPIHIFHSG